jgi:hypothetical protein
MSADQLHLRRPLDRERPEPRLVGEAAVAVDFHHRLVGAQAGGGISAWDGGPRGGRNRRRRRGATSPRLRGRRRCRHGPGVAGQGYHQNFGRPAVEGADRVEAEPSLAVRPVVTAPGANLVELPAGSGCAARPRPRSFRNAAECAITWVDQSFRAAETLPPFFSSSSTTRLWSQMFISALPSLAPV